jgi:hypothetical protein
MRCPGDRDCSATARTVGLLVLISILLLVTAGVALFAYELVTGILGP